MTVNKYNYLYFKDLEKPLTDRNTYKMITMSNNLTALLISDLRSTRCAAALNLNIGSQIDDNDIQGLAHLTEHLIFRGSKSYGKPFQFEEHLSTYGGVANAFTDDDLTSFYFESNCQGFNFALKMFAAMLNEPKFDKIYIDQERISIEEEFEKNINNKHWQILQLIKSNTNITEYNKLSQGNKKTLSNYSNEILIEKVKLFFAKYYKPENMRLVITSDAKIEILEENVLNLFSNFGKNALDTDETISNNNQTNLNITKKAKLKRKFNIKHYNSRKNQIKQITDQLYPNIDYKLGKTIYYNIKSEQNYNQIEFFFFLNEINSNYKLKPLEYFNYIFNYKGFNTLNEYLTLNQLATKISSKIINSNNNFSQLRISVKYSNKNIENTQHLIINSVFAYIEIIKTKINQDILKEIAQIQKIKFKFQETNKNLENYLTNLASNMFVYNPRDILTGDYLIENFNLTILNSFLNNIKLSNCLILISDRALNQMDSSKNKIEPIYNTTYQVKSDFKLDNKNFNNFTFKIRPKNEFITNQTNLIFCDIAKVKFSLIFIG